MKKLLIASMTAALTAGVWADLTKTQTSFEDGFNKGDGFWTTETADENITVGTYGDGNVAYTYGNPAANTRAEAFGSAQNQFLKLETEAGKALWRNLAAEAGGVATVDADNSYVLDTLVQFTATDEAPTAAAGDKFILWLKSDEDAGTTSLMVTCGKADSIAAEPSGTATVELGANVAAGQWARVSVKAIKYGTGTDDVGTIGFVVYVDGVAVAAKSAAEYEKAFPTAIVEEEGFEDVMTAETKFYYNQRAVFLSMVSGDAQDFNGEALSSVGFEGSGSIDDLQIVAAADAPSFTQYTPGVVNFTVKFQAVGVDSWTADDITVASGATIESMPATTVEGYEFKGWFTDAACTIEFNQSKAIDANMTIYAKFEAVVTPAEPVAPGETVTAATADEAKAALTKAGIKTPSTVTDADAYKAKFEAVATPNSDGTYSATWEVTAAAAESLVADADDQLATTLDAVLDDEASTVTITAQPGFYYTVLSATSVDAAEYTANGWVLAGDTVTLTVPAKSGTQGFYKIGISAVEQK